LSISRLTKSLNCSVEFFPHHCVIQDLQTRKRIGGGREGADGLYYLELSHPITRAALSTSVTPEQWHFRLGHPSLHKLRKIVPFSQSSTFIHCESCQLGKHHKSIYSSRDNKRSENLFDLVHSDVWGPCLVTTVFGFRYFISFVDDHSRMTWIYLLKERLEVPFVLKSFYNEIKNQLSTSILVSILTMHRNTCVKTCILFMGRMESSINKPLCKME
jgi:hypothetical protein